MHENETSNQTASALWQLYRETIFISPRPLPVWPRFVIVTSWNPRGTILSADQNQRLEKKLLTRINQLTLKHLPILGAAPDLSHTESSWLIECSVEKGLAVAKEFQQNALYYVVQDKLWLWPCLLTSHHPTLLGSFQFRVRKGEQ